MNIKCFASNQVIAEGERCRVAAIHQQSTYTPVRFEHMGSEFEMFGAMEHAGDPDAFWSPITGFLSGTYVSYRKIELDDSPANRIIMGDLFRTMLFGTGLTHEGENKSAEPAFDFKALVRKHAPTLHAAFKAALERKQIDLAADSFLEMDFAEALALWDATQDAVLRNRVFFRRLSDPLHELRPLSFGVVHESAYLRLIAIGESNPACARAAYFQRAFAALKDELADTPADDRRFERSSIFRGELELQMKTRLTNYISTVFKKQFGAGLRAVDEDGLPVSHFLNVCKEPLDIIYAVKGLDELNIQFTPVVFAGQDYDNEVGKRYASFVASASAEIRAARMARYGEDDRGEPDKLRKEWRQVSNVGELREFISDVPDEISVGRQTGGYYKVNKIGEVSLFLGELPVGPHGQEVDQVMLRVSA